jgi:NAD-dependent deacetylase
MKEKKKKIVVFSGAGLDAESGIETFRGLKNSMWNNYKIEDVATPEGWRKSRETVLDFYNERRRQMPEVEPNGAHLALAKLEEEYDVIHLTQNVSDLLERANCNNIIHLHGALNMACDCMTKKHKYHIGYNDIELGMKCPETDSQLRPDIVWFGEMPHRVDEAYDAVYNADILIVVGTSLQIGYTLDVLTNVRQRVSDESNPCRIIYVDPEPMNYLSNYGLKVEYVRKAAVEGITEIVDELLKLNLN